jgi:hypothetical protein
MLRGVRPKRIGTHRTSSSRVLWALLAACGICAMCLLALGAVGLGGDRLEASETDDTYWGHMRLLPRSEMGGLLSPPPLWRPPTLPVPSGLVQASDELGLARMGIVARPGEDLPPLYEAKPSSDETVSNGHDKIHVWMDFFEPSSSFGRNHHKALQSLLARHPNASVRVVVVAPELYTNYQYANVLGRTHFIKYMKMGYDVQIMLVNDRSLNNSNLPSFRWWKAEAVRCCRHFLEPR